MYRSINLQIAVYQGDPLPVLMFNTVINTLVDTITKCYPDLGYSLTSSPHQTNLLQYADDTFVISDGPSSCKTVLAAIEDWLMWFGMKANVPKCLSLTIQTSNGKPYSPTTQSSTLNGKTIPPAALQPRAQLPMVKLSPTTVTRHSISLKHPSP